MIGYHIEYEPHTAFVESLTQCNEGIIATEMRIDLSVILYIIFVVAR